MENIIWILGFVFSLSLCGFMALFLFGTGIGQTALKRWKNKALYKKGGYTNAIIFTKDGLAKEFFTKNIDGKFTYNDLPYVRVPKLSFPYMGIPTFAYIEGDPSPIDVYGLDKNMLLSANEMDIVMNQQMNFDFKEWFHKNIGMILLGVGVIVLLLGANIYFGYSMYEWIRDGAPAIQSSMDHIVQSAVV